MQIKEAGKLILAIIISQSAGIIGSLFTFSSINSWYALLNKPFFNPPSWVFGPVWIGLYTLIGISIYLIWNAKNTADKKKALWLFVFQLILNTLWTIIFFGFQKPWLAFIEILVLWIAIIFTIKAFLKVSKKAAYLLVPYLLWVSFAMILNLSIAILN